MQVDNINQIKYLRNVFEELSKYGIDVCLYQEKLKLIISQYEAGKLEIFYQNFQNNTYIANVSDMEMALCMNLAKLKEELKYYILFLNVIHVTDDWNIDYEIDDVFYDINNNFKAVLNMLFKIDVQDFFISRFYDLLLKKIWKDYLNDNFTYLEKYNDLKNQAYLQDSVKRFLVSDKINFSLSGNICNYSLTEIFENVCNSRLKEDNIIESVVEVDSIKTEIVPVSNCKFNYFGKMLMNIYAFIKEHRDNLISMYANKNSKQILLKMKYHGVDLEWLGEAAEEVIERVGIECVEAKCLANCDLSGIDLSEADFTNVYISGCNLKGTNVKIDPQEVYSLDLNNCNLEGLDLSEANFEDVCIIGANLKNTGARIDATKIYFYSTSYESRFKNSLACAILESCYLEGCYILNNIDFKSEGICFENLGNPVLIDSFDDIPFTKYSWLGKVEIVKAVIERVGINFVEKKVLRVVICPG